MNGIMARKFLIVVAIVILLVITGRVIFEQYGDELAKLALVPGEEFSIDTVPPAPDYTQDASWAALPSTDNGAKMQPAGVDGAPPLDVDVFFIHPTTYLSKANWNGPIDDKTAAERVDNSVLKGQASAFNAAGHIYAPRYRQATFGAFLAPGDSSYKAFFTAYDDVKKAFEAFLARRDRDRPFILAGHSQGAVHGLGLLRDYIAGKPLKNQMVAAYLIGWPISVEQDLEAIGLSACDDADDTHCVISWQSFAPDGDATPIIEAFKSLPSVIGASRAGSTMLCVNPLNWTRGTDNVGATQNPGAVAYPNGQGALESIEPELVGANCGSDGILYLDKAPEEPFNENLMPGKNYHVYDIPLFYMSLASNARLRAQSFLMQ